MSGLTPTGLEIETVQEIRAGISAELGSEFGALVKAAAQSDTRVLGFTIGIVAERFGTLWELLQQIHGSLDPDNAVDAFLDAVCALTGTTRDPATSSTVVASLTGTPGTVITVGSRASVDETEEEFSMSAEVTIAVIPTWAAATDYDIGDRVELNGVVWHCTIAGTSDAGAGPDPSGQEQGDSVADNTVTWIYLGDGSGVVDVDASSVEAGAIVALSGTLVNIETPISGWDGVYNVEDADLGGAVESNSSLRVKREVELARAGTGPVDAVRADLLSVEGVTSATVFNNPDDETDANGVPPHSVECLVKGGTDQDIWDKLLESVDGGIRTHGDEVGFAQDSEGTLHEMAFSRHTEIDIYLVINLEKDADEYPSNGDTLVAKAIVNAKNNAGLDAVSTRLKAEIFKKVAGVIDIPDLFIGTSPGPGSEATVVITSRQIADYDTGRITVNSSDGTP